MTAVPRVTVKLTKAQISKATKLLRDANVVTEQQKSLILSFMGGIRWERGQSLWAG